MKKSEIIQNLLSEYLSIDTHITDEMKVPEMPVKVSNIDEAESIQKARTDAQYFNVDLRRKRLERIGRKTEIENEIRSLSPMNVWIPYWVDNQIYHVGFQTTDWPMDTPRMRLKKEGENLSNLKHIVNAGVSRFS